MQFWTMFVERECTLNGLLFGGGLRSPRLLPYSSV